ncbi:TIGR02269 family lipoprotein [Archangium violaceum]|uniref:SitA6 family polymorphic toxin lipoprotein n=1 Tax=Archangium violaceum TaxID=83451 RepID=UPI0019521B76|nr:TIGR02269 family lipoprotein [Archangium violaceum]QRN96747.1 TIGR02269 family lipoprotein [Archangium violaceum]
MHDKMRLWGLLLGVLLAGCAASGPSSREEEVPLDTTCQEEDSCLVLACDEEVCGFFFCEDVVVATSEEAHEADGQPGSVVLARGGSPVAITLPSPVTPMRYRGWPLRLPEDREPVFVIPWRNHHLRGLLPSQKQLLEEIELRMRRPHEKHHIFPREFIDWFKFKGIDIHQYTLLIEELLHKRIHRGANGGEWNAAWRQYIQTHQKATREEIWKFAWELCVRFGIYGAIQPYYSPIRLPPPIRY